MDTDDFSVLLACVNDKGHNLLKELKQLRESNTEFIKKSEAREVEISTLKEGHATALQEAEVRACALQTKLDTLSRGFHEQKLENDRLKAKLTKAPKRRLSATFDYPDQVTPRADSVTLIQPHRDAATPPEPGEADAAIPTIEPHSPGPRIEIPHFVMMAPDDKYYVAADNPDLTPLDKKTCGDGWERDNGALLREHCGKKRKSNRIPENLGKHRWTLSLIKWSTCEHGAGSEKSDCLACIRRSNGAEEADQVMRAVEAAQTDDTPSLNDSHTRAVAQKATSSTETPISPRDISMSGGGGGESRMVISGQEYPFRTPRKDQREPETTFDDPSRSPPRPIVSPSSRQFSLGQEMPKIGTNVRGRYFNPSDPRRDGLQHTSLRHLERRATDPRRPDHPDIDNWKERKSICIHCWETSGFCDFNAQCRTCNRDGVKCVRKLCDGGLQCKNSRCPCLHPGEWDENDKSWHVEGGRLPPKKPNPPVDPRTMKRARSPADEEAEARRMPCCERCWKLGKWCLGGPRCSNCQTAGKGKCAYRRCKWGLDCRSVRCVYIHPGQYDERDGEWTIEEGDIGTKNAWRK